MADGFQIFGPGPQAQFVQQSPRLRRKLDLADLLTQQGADTSPIQHPLQGFARLAQALAGVKLSGEANRETEQRGRAAQQTLAEALRRGGRAKTFVHPDTGQAAQDTTPTAVMARILATNPDTAPRAAQLQLDQFQRQEDQRVAQQQAAAKRQADLASQQVRAATPQEVAALKLPVGSSVVINEATGKPTVLNTPTPLSPRDEAFNLLTDEQKQRALGGLPAPLSPRDKAFQNLTPAQQVQALGGNVPAGALKTRKAFLLSDNTVVSSLDGGRTYTSLETGESIEIPSDAVPLGAETGADQARLARIRKKAQAAVEAVVPGLGKAETRDAMQSAANFGTGPWSNLAAATDAVIGGTFNVGTMFPQTADNRQHLRVIKQMGKAGLLNSARGAIWEQQKIDELFPDPDVFWTNPSAEARKVPEMVRTLNEMKLLNNQVIAQGTSNVELVEKLIASNLDIDRTLALLGTGQQQGGNARPQTQADFDALPSGAQYIDPDSGETRIKN